MATAVMPELTTPPLAGATAAEITSAEFFAMIEAGVFDETAGVPVEREDLRADGQDRSPCDDLRGDPGGPGPAVAGGLAPMAGEPAANHRSPRAPARRPDRAGATDPLPRRGPPPRSRPTSAC